MSKESHNSHNGNEDLIRYSRPAIGLTGSYLGDVVRYLTPEEHEQELEQDRFASRANTEAALFTVGVAATALAVSSIFGCGTESKPVQEHKPASPSAVHQTITEMPTHPLPQHVLSLTYPVGQKLGVNQ